MGDDTYGDIGFDTSTTCGADILLWSSLATRTYEKGTRSFAPAEIPPSLVGRLSDRDKNGIPDSMENIATGTLQNMYENMPDSSIPTKNPIFVSQVDPSRRILSLGFSPQAEQDIEDMVQGIADGLSCGFG